MNRAGAPVLTVLGVAPAASAARVAALAGSGEGPPVMVRREGGIAAFAVQGVAWRQHRRRLRERLSRAAAAAPFLPAEPRHATCPASAWPRLVAVSAPLLATALERGGSARQWEFTITPHRADASPASVAAALRASLAGKAEGFRVRPSGRGLTLSVLLPREETARAGLALGTLAPSLAKAHRIVTEGPLPPLGFSAFRIAPVDGGEIARAWAMLALRDTADPAELARRWRGLAFALDPERAGQGASPRPLREAEWAYGLLRSLSAGLGKERFARDDLMALSGLPLAFPPARHEAAARRSGAFR